MSREKYKSLISIVRGVIHRWDPYGLLAGGAPMDEFDHEIALVAARVRQIRTEADSVTILSAVFSEMFIPGDFILERCADPGRELFEELRNTGFIQ